MQKWIYCLLLVGVLFSCEKTTSRPIGVSDLVTGELVFEVTYLPCDLPANCDAMPIFDATIRLWKLVDGGNSREFIGERKTDVEGRQTFNFVPLGVYEAVVSTNYGDQRPIVESIAGIPTEVQVQFP